MVSSRITILATGAAFVLGALGANAMGDDGNPFGEVEAVNLGSQQRDDDGGKDDDRRIDGKRDDYEVDVDPRDEDDDGDRDTGNRDADSGGPHDADDSGTMGGKDRTGGRHGGTGGDSRERPSVSVAAPAPAPAPVTPVYDDYSDDGGAYYGGGSDYGDS